MLPSRGFFKKNDCPYFEKGLCVRPHCHFRHKKKVLNENSSVDSQEDLILSENLEIPLNSINNTEISVKTTADNYSCDTTLPKDESSQYSLFAKLVNQTDPYEKIYRHIPCAYTPTPQSKGVQPKNKSITSKFITSDSKNALPDTKTFFDGYKSITNEQSKNNSKEEINSINCSSRAVNKNSLVNSPITSFLPKNLEDKIPFLDNSNKECYKLDVTINSLKSDSHENKFHDFSSDYMPSKVTATESRYIPKNNDSTPPTLSYVPSKEKPKQSQYVPESSGNVKNQVFYKPSDKTTAGETQYQPESSSYVADYVPTEKSATKTISSSWLDNDCKNKLTDIKFISPEMELMKELLKDEKNTKTTENDNSKPKTESTKSNSKDKKYTEEKLRSSKSHSSSSSSSRSRSSSHHHSSSSRHHSSSKSKRFDRTSSDRHKSSSSSHDEPRHHRSHHKSKSRDKIKYASEGKNDNRTSKKNKVELKKLDSSIDDLVDDEFQVDCDSGKEENSDKESVNGTKKRKNTGQNENRPFKFLKKDAEELFEELEEDPDTVEKQCLEIFNNYSSTKEIKKPNEIFLPPEEYENTVQAKKRTAHSTVMSSDHSILRHKTSKTSRNNIKSAQEVMLERYKVVEKAIETQHLQPPPPQPTPILGLSKPSIKIAAVSNIQQMLQAKKAIQEKISQGVKVTERTTIAQTVSHGGTRVAHIPAAREIIERPTVNGGSKQVPRIKRQIYLDKLLLETSQIYPTKEESAQEALKLEEEVFRANSGSSSAYHAAFVSMLLKTRRRVNALKGEAVKSNAPIPKMSHYDVLSGGKKNFSVIKTKKVDISMLTDRHIYEELLRCKLTPEELKENGYPVEGAQAGYATCSLNFELKYNDKYLHIRKMTGNRRYCIRCSKQYEIDPVTLKQYKEGPETCCYHPGKKKSGGRNCDRIYSCCNSSSSEGCATHVRHVTDCNDYENLPNCVKTFTKENETNPGVFALDCEMVYTRLGYELARVTVVNLKKEIVYDTFVKPKYPIEDCNTAFSGIEEKMMEGVETTLKDVQAVLLSMFSDKTILIGHSLDSDLRALHLIHDNVVDTAILYKNEKYYPYKYSLKYLCAKKISKIIQDNVNGHDSAEDAIAALEIMLNHVKEEVSKYDSLESYEADRAK